MDTLEIHVPVEIACVSLILISPEKNEIKSLDKEY